MKILLIEDSGTLRLSNERALLEAGYAVICAEDGESGVRRAKQQMPDLILLDLLPPKVIGFEVSARLKHSRGTARIPAIAVNGHSERSRQRLIEANAEDFLEKSAIMTEKGTNRLPQALGELIRRMNRRRSIFSTPVLKKKS